MLDIQIVYQWMPRGSHCFSVLKHLQKSVHAIKRKSFSKYTTKHDLRNNTFLYMETFYVSRYLCACTDRTSANTGSRLLCTSGKMVAPQIDRHYMKYADIWLGMNEDLLLHRWNDKKWHQWEKNDMLLFSAVSAIVLFFVYVYVTVCVFP